MKILQNVSLKDHSHFKIGGNAQYFLEVKTTQDLLAGLSEWIKISKDLPAPWQKIFVLGSGTNLLFSDEGFEGLVIKNSIDSISVDNDVVTVGSGTLVSDLLKFTVDNSLTGLEWAGGLPGTLGGAVRGNAGAYSGETKDNLIEVESVNLNTPELLKRTNEDCEFAYRTSVFKKNGDKEIITNVKFKLKKGVESQIKMLIDEKIESRKSKHPLEFPNVGSIFKNVPTEKIDAKVLLDLAQYAKDDPFAVIPTAKINFLAGLSGTRVGDAQLSTKHTNFIVNLGNASAKDVKELILIIKKTVKEKFNIDLEEEVMFVN